MGGIPRFRALLAAGADIHERDQKGRTALFRVCRVGQTEKVLMLLAAGADPNTTDLKGEAPLQAAARYGNLDCVRALLQAGAALNYCPPPAVIDANNHFDYSESALCSAARKSPPAAQLLLELGADPNAVTQSKKYPLLAAIFAGNEEVVRLLLKHGAALKITDEQGRTPLHYAVSTPKPDMIKLLVEAGADPNVKGGWGEPPIFAAIGGNESANLPALRQLLAAKPDLSVRNSVQDMTPLEWAIEVGEKEAAKLLREAGSPPPRPGEEEGGSVTITINLEDFEEAEGLEESDGGENGETDWRSSMEPVDEAALLPTAQDTEWACQADRDVPSLLIGLGHRVSKPHWELLRHAENPLPLIRMAYFSRGFFNRPAGKELEDWKKVLGETYESAAEHFVAQGFLKNVTGPRAIQLAFSQGELSALAKHSQVKVSGTKAELAERLFSALGEGPFAERLRAMGGFFELTPSGAQEASQFDAHRGTLETQKRREVISALGAQDFLGAAKGARILALLKNSVRGVEVNTKAEDIAQARFIRSCSLPPSLHFTPGSETNYLAVAAADVLFRGSGDDWASWDPAIEPPKTNLGKAVKLYVFSAALRGWLV